jgi:hypothetical protein
MWFAFEVNQYKSSYFPIFCQVICFFFFPVYHGIPISRHTHQAAQALLESDLGDAAQSAASKSAEAPESARAAVLKRQIHWGIQNDQ